MQAIKGQQALLSFGRRLLGIGNRFTALKPVLTVVSIDMGKEIDQRFDSGKDPSGKPWKPSQRVLREGGKTLIDKGDLKNSKRPHASNTTAGVDFVGVPYARIHDEGGFAGRNRNVRIPQRRFTGFGPGQRKRYVKQIGRYLLTGKV